MKIRAFQGIQECIHLLYVICFTYLNEKMAENLTVAQGGKAEMYETLLPQIEALIAGETDAVANMANVAAALKQTFGFFWVGFYVAKGEELVLAPFQGPVACTRIRYGKGVCGRAWQEGRTIVVADVDLFPGHIACNAASRSEIVVPIVQEGAVAAVLDIDSDRPGAFDATDAAALERIARMLR
jgi:GAF domain-containing protein